MASQSSPNPDPNAAPDPPLAGPPKPSPLEQLLQRLPPRYRTKKWVIGVPLGTIVLLLMLIQCGLMATGGEDSAPAPVVAEVPTPIPTPIPAVLPSRPTPTPLPHQYSFQHFVREMAACYDQRGLDSTLTIVEADIMQDVPLAVTELLRLYSENDCEEVSPWHQIKGRVGWMLRAANVGL